MENIKISFKPTEKNLYEIKSWIDYPESSMSTIYTCYKNNSLIVATVDNIAIAYYALNIKEVTVFISLAEVKTNLRGNGIGKLILNEIEKNLQHSKFKTLYLYCSPKESQFYWKKQGFDYFPENSKKNRTDKVEMFKLINPVLQIDNSISIEGEEYLEVWNDKSCYVESQKSSWKWKIEYLNAESSILKVPFVFFGDRNWKIRWSRGSTILKESDYKYFDRRNEVSECMYIEKMPNP